jgi:hypothetical protein
VQGQGRWSGGGIGWTTQGPRTALSSRTVSGLTEFDSGTTATGVIAAIGSRWRDLGLINEAKIDSSVIWCIGETNLAKVIVVVIDHWLVHIATRQGTRLSYWSSIK